MRRNPDRPEITSQNYYLFGLDAQYKAVKEWTALARSGEKDLRDAYLSSARLRFNLSGADLSFAYLGSADFHEAPLSGAKFFRAELRAANLEFCDLQGADLRFANLRGANLLLSNLKNANLFGANLDQVNISRTPTQQGGIPPTKFERTNMMYANISSWTAVSTRKWDSTNFDAPNIDPPQEGIYRIIDSEFSEIPSNDAYFERESFYHPSVCIRGPFSETGLEENQINRVEKFIKDNKQRNIPESFIRMIAKMYGD